MVKLRVSVGGSYTDLAIVNCNDELHPIEFDAPEFKGRAVIRIKDFVGITNDGSEPIHNSDYFKGHNRRFSMQVEGRFKREWLGEDVYFGTDFDRSVELPQGFETMLKIARYIDPVVRTSLTKDGKPWILSPLVSSINTMAAWRPQDANLPSPPLTPRHSTEMAQALNMSESSSMWGFLGKLKKGNRGSVASLNSNTSHGIYGSQPNSANNSTDHLDAAHHNHHRYTNGSSHVGEHSSLSSSTTSSDWARGSSMASSTDHLRQNGASTVPTTEAIFDDSDMPLGQWRSHVEEDTTFFIPKKPSMTTPQRRKHFQTEEARKQFVFKTDLVHGFEFFSPHMDFNTFDIRMGLSMNIRKYLRGQPVRYTCRTLNGDTVFWAVQFELVD
ncbi:hypothetical protein EMPS_01089 [Entomortierella parvispora]|uniref:Domain of unknown function at the cortex 1 domain-containing protein n=1 Tax=Entomortierella parvispora TaxID=205924 RepID=A0A9P3H2X3_9FUNG|nr:hypothetical protein EMPS_01089 [Entomortierella parvispora]